MNDIDRTHAPGRRSFVASANGHPEFPIQNLPLGVFSPAGGKARGGIAIGDHIFDLSAALELGLFSGLAAEAARAACGATLNALFALSRESRRALRHAAAAISSTRTTAPRSKRAAGAAPASGRGL